MFTQDVIDMWLSYKRKNEVDPICSMLHLYELVLYVDITLRRAEFRGADTRSTLLLLFT